MLSVIIPAFNEQDNIDSTAEEITRVLKTTGIPFELVFVDDGSLDFTWEKISALSEKDSHVRGIRFSRNFGKEGAIFAGLNSALESGTDAAVIIDCDLQHPPQTIPEMYRLWTEGFEVVEGVKASRGKEGLLYKCAAKIFYKLMNGESGNPVRLEGGSDFKLLDKKAIAALLDLPERLTFFRALSSWIGFKTARVPFEVQPRRAGKTKWRVKSLVKFALSNLTSFTNLPMQFITMMGILFFILSLAVGINTLILYFNGSGIGGFPTVILLLLIIGSFLMIGQGITGYYISKIYEEIKFRPRYIVARETKKAPGVPASEKQESSYNKDR